MHVSYYGPNPLPSVLRKREQVTESADGTGAHMSFSIQNAIFEMGHPHSVPVTVHQGHRQWSHHTKRSAGSLLETLRHTPQGIAQQNPIIDVCPTC